MEKILLNFFYIILNIIAGVNLTADSASVPTAAENESASLIVYDDFVSALSCAKNYDQLIVVSATGSDAVVTMHEKNSGGIWEEIMNTTGYVGKNGVGKASESDTKTPAGDFGFGIAFGISPNPGTIMDYIQVDDTYYWVDDSSSACYNRFVTTKDISPQNWNSAEHIIDYPDAYAYVISIDYNSDCIPGAGSAIFLHCSNGKPTLGCVSIPAEDMVFVLTHIKKGCRIIIDTPENLVNY